MGTKVTAADVARVAGVSPATVDRVLNHRGGVSEDKEKRVFAAARELGIDRALDHRAARTLQVAALLQPATNIYHKALADAFRAANRGPNPYNIETRVFHIDPSDDAVETVEAIKGTHDAVVVCLQNEAGLADALTEVSASGVPIVTLATDLPVVDAVYVGPDNYQAGRLAGDLMGRLLGRDGGEILLVVGTSRMMGQLERRAGFEDVLSERYPNCRVVAARVSGEVSLRARSATAETLEDYPALAGIYNASAGVEEVAKVLQAQGVQDQVVYIAHETSQRRRALLASGVIDFLIDQDPELEVATTLDIIAAAHDRCAVAPRPTETQVRLYCRENT